MLYSAGRQGATDELDLERAGLEADKRGRIEVDETTAQGRHIYAVGDVIGFPSLAATLDGAGPAGRLRRLRPAGARSSEPMPIGIYTIPEISYVGGPRRS